MDRRIRVLMMLDAFDIGGTETYVLSITKELLKQGVSVYVSGDPGLLENEFRMLHCKIFNHRYNMRKLKEWIQRHKIDVINAHLESSGVMAVDLSEALQIPLLFTFHGTYYSDSFVQKLRKATSIKPVIVSVSTPVQKWLRTRKIHSKLIPNGIDMKVYYKKPSDIRKKLDISADSKIVLYASRLEDEKYKICKLLLKAFEKEILPEFPNVQLLIAGGGTKVGNIKKYTKRTTFSKQIQYIGNRKDMPDVYSIGDYVVGTGRVALEAIACECPVIAIGSKGTFGLVTPDNFHIAMKYYFCDHRKYLPLTQNQIGNAVRQCLQSENQNNHWSSTLRQQVQQTFDVTLITNKLRKVYKEML